ncbi:BPSL0761 family protein [Xanthomonas arboricola]|uniref:BPSL0761 family protein n=1 Tax=Xanthomonas arboricola TaxID=56448 RepID=UPI002803ADA7|nr:BPSL0761 family protein [Xanthomonas arboricola]
MVLEPIRLFFSRIPADPQAGAFLKELAGNQAVPKSEREEAYRLLRHYPTLSDVEAIAQHEERLRELT